MALRRLRVISQFIACIHLSEQNYIRIYEPMRNTPYNFEFFLMSIRINNWCKLHLCVSRLHLIYSIQSIFHLPFAPLVLLIQMSEGIILKTFLLIHPRDLHLKQPFKQELLLM